MRYFIDTEFIERGPRHPIELISIGIVAEHGDEFGLTPDTKNEFYRCNRGFNPHHANDWVKANVLPLLPMKNPGSLESPRIKQEAWAWQSLDQIAQELKNFIGDDPDPEFWGYYCDYDYVVFSQIFGGMDGYPSHWPYYFRDLRQLLDWELFGAIKQPDDAPHNALQDARWIAQTLKKYLDIKAAMR